RRRLRSSSSGRVAQAWWERRAARRLRVLRVRLVGDDRAAMVADIFVADARRSKGAAGRARARTSPHFSPHDGRRAVGVAAGVRARRAMRSARARER
ncbi:MAG TPA: hypothetical protein VIS76_13475, partial [Pseudomonadales bacterium]